MSKFDNSKIMPRYSVIAIIMSLIAVAVIGKTIYTMTAGRSYWMEVAASQKKTVFRSSLPGVISSVAMGNSWQAQYLSLRFTWTLTL